MKLDLKNYQNVQMNLISEFNKEELDLFWKGLRIHGRSPLAIAKMIPT